MPRFSANLSLLCAEHDFLDRFAAARAEGFKADLSWMAAWR